MGQGWPTPRRRSSMRASAASWTSEPLIGESRGHKARTLHSPVVFRILHPETKMESKVARLVAQRHGTRFPHLQSFPASHLARQKHSSLVEPLIKKKPENPIPLNYKEYTLNHNTRWLWSLALTMRPHMRCTRRSSRTAVTFPLSSHSSG